MTKDILAIQADRDKFFLAVPTSSSTGTRTSSRSFFGGDRTSRRSACARALLRAAPACRRERQRRDSAVLVVFRNDIMNLFAVELGGRFDPAAEIGLRRTLNFVGGAMIATSLGQTKWKLLVQVCTQDLSPLIRSIPPEPS